MSKKQKYTLFGCLEGKREIGFIEFLKGIYLPAENDIKFEIEPSLGGAPDKIVATAIRERNRKRSFAWFDEDSEPDYPLSPAQRESLAECWVINREHLTDFMLCPLKDLQGKYNIRNRNPVLIVSQPVCSESLLLKAPGYPLPYEYYDHHRRKQQIDGLKDKLNSITQKQDLEHYRKHLPKQRLEEKSKTIPELNLLIAMLKGL